MNKCYKQLHILLLLLKKFSFPFLVAIFLFAAGDVLAIDGNVAEHFTIVTPDTAKAGEPFTVKIIAKDEFGIVITDYDEVGGDVEITTTGSGTISPALVAASEFKDGIATVDFVYDKAESFTIIAEEARLTAQRKEAEERVKREAEERARRGLEERRRKEEKARAGVREYTIGEEDVLDISVWGWEDLAVREAIVRPDGKISFPLVGDVQAVGLTLTELDRDLTERLKVYIRSPEVSVMLRKFGGKKVIVLGEVKSPGVYRATGKNTILEVIALAGGPTEDAVLRSVILVRGDLMQPEARRVNLAKVIKKGDLAENISVQPEDIVYVPRKFIANVNYFLRQLTPVLQAGTLYSGFPPVVSESDD